MSTKRIASFKHGRCRQRGAALLIMLVILVVGIAAVLVNSLTSSTVKIARQEKTAAALAQAKDALIGFAITYDGTHSGQVFGYLPCPDPNGTAGVNGEGSSETCGNHDVSVIGRLPWKTLDLSTLRDGDGECLWYAVSGTYKDNPKTTGLMNWDTEGQFQAFAAAGTPLTNQNQVVAVIFAPGAPLSGQNRSPDGSAPICGGNYTTSNYLDSDATIGADNAALSSTTSPPAANASSQFFTAGATTKINDQMIFITKQDIWNAIKKRNDFGAFVAKLLKPLIAYSPTTVDFSATPPPPTESLNPTAVGCLKISRVRRAYLYPFTLTNNWQDNVLYARPKSGNCAITVNGATTPCSYGVVIFPGERNTGQTRITNADKNTWSNYLEGANFTAFNTGGPTTTVSFSGATSYNAASPSTDVLACE